MKKFLVLLLISLLAIFVFAGCDGIIDDGNGDDNGDGNGDEIVAADITFENEYEKTAGVAYIPCSDTVTVTLPEAVPADEFVYLAVKVDDTPTYEDEMVLEPSADRKTWTGTWVSPVCEGDETECVDECEMYCVAALIGHPCCSPEEVAVEVVIPDCTEPEIDLYVRFVDCCVEDDCAAGVYMEWTSTGSENICDDPVECCEDNCSGVGDWAVTIEPDPCDEPCEVIPGNDCPVEGTSGCDCLYYDSGETVTIKFDVADNVGNSIDEEWDVVVTDTSEAVLFDGQPVDWIGDSGITEWLEVPITGFQ
jgi:hypothetical protein